MFRGYRFLFLFFYDFLSLFPTFHLLFSLLCLSLRASPSFSRSASLWVLLPGKLLESSSPGLV